MSSTTSVAELAERWGCRQDHVLALIKSGQLRAVNLALDPSGRRPRWRINEGDVIEFEQRRASGKPEPKQKRRRSDSRDVVEFF